MSNLHEILAYNKEFVRNKDYQKYPSNKLPSKKMAIFTCMDTRLVKLLPAALGINNGDVKMIKSAGAQITGPFDGAVRSLLIGITELEVEEILVIGHTNCGAGAISAPKILNKLIKLGISKDVIDSLDMDMDTWLSGFDSVKESVLKTVNALKSHPLMPIDINITGLIIDSQTGELNLVSY